MTASASLPLSAPHLGTEEKTERKRERKSHKLTFVAWMDHVWEYLVSNEDGKRDVRRHEKQREVEREWKDENLEECECETLLMVLTCVKKMCFGRGENGEKREREERESRKNDLENLSQLGSRVTRRSTFRLDRF